MADVIQGTHRRHVEIEEWTGVALQLPMIVPPPLTGSEVEPTAGELHMDEHRVERCYFSEGGAEFYDLLEGLAVTILLQLIEKLVYIALHFYFYVLEVLLKQALAEPCGVV